MPLERSDTALDLWPDLDRRLVYINAASRTPLPACVLAAGLSAVRRKAASPWDIGDTEADKDACRELFAELLGAGASMHDIAVLPCCSSAMSVAAHNMRGVLRARPRERRRVLVLQDQNPSNVMQWQHLCEEEGGQLLAVPWPAEGREWAPAIVSHVASGAVAVCALPPCHWCDGSVVDLERVGDACRAAGCKLVVDGTQWVGAAETIDVVRIGACFLACSIHKWLLGPYGACLCYASPSFWRDAATLDHHDRNREGAQHVECIPFSLGEGYPTAFRHGARRLDGGGRPSFIVMPMLRRALTLLAREITIPRLVAELGSFTRELAARARALGFIVPPRHATNILGLSPSKAMPSAAEIVRRLATRRPRPVLVSERLGKIRVAPHLYNTRSDLDELVGGLQAAVAQRPAAARL